MSSNEDIETISEITKRKKFRNDKEREKARKELIEQLTEILVKKPLVRRGVGHFTWFNVGVQTH
jgi:hypothetical protein